MLNSLINLHSTVAFREEEEKINKIKIKRKQKRGRRPSRRGIKAWR